VRRLDAQKMKIAVLSDVHGNLPALEAVLEHVERWEPDEIIVNGDLVSRGPYSRECLRFFQARFPQGRLLKGNHESFVVHCADTPPHPEEPTYDLSRFACWTARRLGEAVEEIRTWADQVDSTGWRGGSSFHITHGSRLGNREGIQPEMDGEALVERLGDPRDLFIGSHTHRAFERRFNGTLVVNTGSVGQPLDGDPRAAYGRFTFQGGQWHSEIMRVRYDKARAERDFIDSGFLDECGPIARLIYREVRESRWHVAAWRRLYLQPVTDGEMTVVDAVDDYLRAL
jgi:predicted phosphodiesterase